MDIQIIEHIKEKLQVVINCRQIDDEIIWLKYHIEMFDKKLQAKKDKEQLALIIRCSRACLKNAFREMCFTLGGEFIPNL